MTPERLDVAPTRWRWIGDRDTLDVGDRTLHAIRSPLYYSPTTSGLFDPTTGVHWAPDCYATPVLAGAHTPTIPATHLDQAFAMLRAMPTTPAPPMPDQGALDQMLATLQG